MNAAKNLVKNARKTYTLKDLIVADRIKEKNLMEMLAEYPNKGVGFKISKFYWPDGHYVKIGHVQFHTNRTGKVWGKKYIGGQPETGEVEEVERVSTRGLWRYELGDGFYTGLGGVMYTLNDFEKHYNTVSQRKRKGVEEMRKNMNWQAPEGEPYENANVTHR